MFALKIAKNKCTAKRKYDNEHRTFIDRVGELIFFMLNVMVSHFALYVRRH